MKHVLLKTEDGCLYIENGIADYLEGIFIHWDIYNWTPSNVRKYKRMWLDIVVNLHNKGLKDIYALPPSEFEEKLIKMFGFKDTGLLFNGFKIMRHG
jgi:hypothetical protein